MAVKITRAEYEAKFGRIPSPTVPASEDDPQAMLGEQVTTPAPTPVKITRAEYAAKFPDDRNIVQRAADLPVVGQAVKGLALGGGDLKALGYRALAKGADVARAVQPGFQGDLTEASKTFGDLATAETQNTNALEEQFAQGSGYGGNIGRGIVRSLGTAVPTAMVAGPVGAIGSAVAIQGNQSLEEGVKAGLTGPALDRYVGSQMLMEGVPAAAMQFAGLGGVEKQLTEPIKAGIREALKRTGFSVIQELPEELVTTLGQQINDQQFGVRELTPESAFRGAFDTAMTVVGTAGLLGAAQYRPGQTTPPTPGSTDTTNPPPVALTVEDEDGFYDDEFLALFAGEQAQPAAPQPSTPQQDSSGDPFAGTEFVGKEGTVVKFKTSNPIEITYKDGGVESMRYAVLDNDDGTFRIHRIDEDGPSSLGDDGLWYKSGQPMPNRRDKLVSEEIFTSEKAAQEWALRDASDMGWNRPSTTTTQPSKTAPRNVAYAPDAAPQPMQRPSSTGPTPPPPPLRVAPIAPGSAVMREVPPGARIGRAPQSFQPGQAPTNLRTMLPPQTLGEPETQAWLAEAEIMRAGEQEIIADYLMANPGNPQRLSPGEIMAISNRDMWRMTPDEQAEYERAMGVAGEQPEDIRLYPAAREMTLDELDEFERSILGELAPTAPVEAAPTPPTPAPVQPEIVAPRAAQEPISATVELVTEFTTAKGSTYKVYSDKSTIRDKAARPEHPGEQGVQPRSTKTFYVTPEEATLLSEVQSQGPKMAIMPLPDGSGRVGVQYFSGKDAGGFEKRTVITPKWEPAVGLMPIEIWDDGKKTSNHFGNKIVSVSTTKSPAPTKPKRTPPPAKGSTSSTGWSTVAKGVARKDIMGRNVEVVRQADGTWSVTRDEQEVDSGYKSRAEAERYADGELAQDIRDQRNAEEEDIEPIEAFHGTPKKFNGEFRVSQDGMLGKGIYFTKDEGQAHRIYAGDGPNSEVKKVLLRIKKPWDVAARQETPREHYGSMSNDDLNARLKADGYDAVIDHNEVVVLDKSQIEVVESKQGRGRGPAPADTGIFRDLTAAARAGQRFVEDLHVRIAPTLARIHAAAKSPVEFLRAAVTKIGEHIRPYARRFLADVRKVGAEFAANPTRGSIPRNTKKTARLDGIDPNFMKPLGQSKVPEGMVPRYHVTSVDNLASVQSDGLLWNKGKGVEGPKALYSWPSLKGARDYAGSGYENAIVEFFGPKEVWDRHPFAAIIDIPVSQIAAIETEATRELRGILEDRPDIPSSELRGIGGKYAEMADFMDASAKAGGVLEGIRAVNAEFAANPTRGSVPKDAKPLGKRDLEAEYRAGVRDEKKVTKAEKALSSREAMAEGKEASKAASEEAFAEGRKLGVRMGGMRSKDELKALTKKMREVVPPKLRALRERAVARALADNTLSQEKREKKIGGIIEAVRRDVMKYEGVDGVEKALAKVRKALPSMEGSLRKFATDLINSFDTSAPTAKTLEAAEELMSGLADGTIQDGTVNPRAVEKAQRTIENFVSGRNLKSMPLAEVRQLRNILERIEAWHQGGLKAVKERLANDRKDIDQTADDVMADAKKSYPAGDFKDTMSFIQAKENVPMSLRNLIGLLGPKGSRIVKRFVDAFDEGERKTARVRHDAHRHMLNGLAEIGLLKDKGQGVYEATDELLAMSPFITGVASRGPAGRAVGKKLGQAQPEYQEFGGVKYTTGERIKLYNLSRDPDARHALVKGKGSDTVFARNDEFARMDYDTLDDIVNSLSAKERKIADLMFEYNNGKLRDQMNEAWNAMYGHDIFTETNHESMRRRMIGEEPDARAKKLGNSYTENMGILKARQGGDQPIVIDDAFAEFFSHVNKVAMAVGQMQASMDARRAMSTPALEQAIKRSHPRGSAFLRELSDRIDEYGSISAKGVDEVEAGARIFLNNMTGTMVATSPAALITTPMSIPSAQSVIPLNYLLANTRPSTGKAEFAEIEKESPTLYAIITDTGHRVTTPEAAGIGVQRFYGNQKNTVSERITTILRKLNDQAVYAIWRSAKAWGEAQGLKGDALMDFTARKAEEAYSRSQPDNTFTNQSGAKLRARKSLWYTLGTAFQGQTQKAWNQALEARNDYRWSKGTADDKAKYARDVFFPVILQTLLYRGTATAVMYALAAAKDDERKMSEMEKDFWADIGMEGVLDVISQIPMVGGMLSDPMRMVYNGLTGKPKWSGTSSILARTGEEIEKAAFGAGRGLRKLFTGNGEFDPDSIAEPILFLGQGIGVPAKPLKDLKEMVVGAD